MIDQKINNSLKELEQSLRSLESARKQVERTVSSYDGLSSSTSDYVAEIGSLTAKVKELVAAIGTDYAQKSAAFDKDRQAVMDSVNSASQKLSEATDSFRNSLNNIESKLVRSLTINVVLAIALGIVIIIATR